MVIFYVDLPDGNHLKHILDGTIPGGAPAEAPVMTKSQASQLRKEQAQREAHALVPRVLGVREVRTVGPRDFDGKSIGKMVVSPKMVIL